MYRPQAPAGSDRVMMPIMPSPSTVLRLAEEDPSVEEKIGRTETRSQESTTSRHGNPGRNPTDAYDVYATPFIDPALRGINEDTPRMTFTTSSVHLIDFESYIASFCNKACYPTESPVPKLHGLGNVQVALSPVFYLAYFDGLQSQEATAQQHQNARYALYGVIITEVEGNYDGQLWALSIPGLREDSPFVEKGDQLHLRQIHVNQAGHPITMPVQLQDPHTGSMIYSRKMWTGDVHHASVYGIDRSKETVYLTATRLDCTIPWHPMRVNVCFPCKQERYDALRCALWRVSQRLHAEEKQVTESDISMNGKEEINHTTWMTRMLFPEPQHGLLRTSLRRHPHQGFFDGIVNYEQSHAVQSVCKDDFGTLPYLISGPPGTGKTKTLVEITMQLLHTTDVAHVLVCAPSEAAADTLAMRLKKYLTPKQLLRFNRPNRADNEVPAALTGYCYLQNDMYYLPPHRDMMAYNVVVTSCQDASSLVNARLSNNDLYHVERNLASILHPESPLPTPSLHWGALLIDEAAQATEPAVLPAIHLVCPPISYPPGLPLPRLIMAGDEHQLGPRTASRNPQLTTSLFARLCSRPLYAAHPLSRNHTAPYSTTPPILTKSMLPIINPPFTNLIRNYRSHPAILSVPSALFYNNTLIPETPEATTRLQTSPLWRGAKWPVLFIPHTGPDEIERDAGGWYNVSETRIACDLAQQLGEQSHVRQSDICIMSPFAAQVARLRALIRSGRYGRGSGLWSVNIGPVEAFQGLEQRVVILCTTRTRARFLADDQRRGLGIVHEDRKLNVALTRAKEALIVIGNPGVLKLDPCWRAWLAFVWRNGLVSDPGGVWKVGEGEFADEKVGVLERALVAKMESGIGGRGEGRVLGGGGFGLCFGGQSWEESLRATLDEGDRDYEEEEEEE